ncbi:MAG: recombinase family protein [Nanoarchaeota archaeon]|nr:recombinase family protein [Nanoarchaeota archaeon]
MKCPNCNYEFENFQKKGMIKKAKLGNIVSRPAFGYNLEKGKLVPNEDAKKVEQIFLEFNENQISLNQLSKKYNLSVNGLKKILTNFTYLGKVKFNQETHKGKHDAILSSILFNHVQDKLERLGIKIIS